MFLKVGKFESEYFITARRFSFRRDFYIKKLHKSEMIEASKHLLSPLVILSYLESF